MAKRTTDETDSQWEKILAAMEVKNPDRAAWWRQAMANGRKTGQWPSQPGYGPEPAATASSGLTSWPTSSTERPTIEELRAKYGPNWGIGFKPDKLARPVEQPIPWNEQVLPWEKITISERLKARVKQQTKAQAAIPPDPMGKVA